MKLEFILKEQGLKIAMLRLPRKEETSLWGRFGFIWLPCQNEFGMRATHTVAFDEHGNCYYLAKKTVSLEPYLERFTPMEARQARDYLEAFPHFVTE